MGATVSQTRITPGPIGTHVEGFPAAWGFASNTLAFADKGLALGYVASGHASIGVDGVTLRVLEGQWFSAPVEDVFTLTGAATGVCAWYPDAIGLLTIGTATLPEGFKRALLTAGLGPETTPDRVPHLTLFKRDDAAHAPDRSALLTLALPQHTLRFSGAAA